MELMSHNYGKQRVRVMKVLRDAARHGVKELECDVQLEGEFEDSFLYGDNRAVVPTDTIKSTIHALAHHHLGAQTEPFALLLADHFLNRCEYTTLPETTDRILATMLSATWRWDLMAPEFHSCPPMNRMVRLKQPSRANER